MHTTSITRAAWALGVLGLFMGNLAQANLWWEAPALKVDEKLTGISGAVDPHCMNKDENDQLLAFGTGSGGGTVFLYSIPALIAAASSNDVVPIAQGNSGDFWGTLWKGIAVSSSQRRVFTGQTGTKPDHTSFPVTAPWLSGINTFRYVAILCNYTGSNVYNTVDVRIRGEGYNQIRHNNNKWELYNKNTWPLNATGLNSMMYMLYDKPYYTPANYNVLYYNYTNVTLTVRVHMSMEKGPSVYVNDMLVSQMDQNQSFWGERTNWNAYALCFKTSNKVKAEIDNLKIWTGCGAPPVWKSGAVSGRNLRVVTGSGGTPLASSSLALSAPWTRDTSVIQTDAQTVQFDTLDFGRDGSCLYTDNRGGAPRNRIVKWDVGSLTSNGVSLVSNAVYATSVNGLSAINVYGIGGTDLVYYGESVVTNGGAARVCVLDPATGTESLLLSGVPGRVANVKVAGIGLGELLLFVQCDDGALRVYALNADGRSVGALLKAFTPDEIKTLLGGVTFTAMRSFEVTNDGRHAFFTFDGADALYVVEGLPPRSGMVLTLGGE